jgi:hypothetical protein
MVILLLGAFCPNTEAGTMDGAANAPAKNEAVFINWRLDGRVLFFRDIFSLAYLRNIVLFDTRIPFSILPVPLSPYIVFNG